MTYLIALDRIAHTPFLPFSFNLSVIAHDPSAVDVNPVIQLFYTLRCAPRKCR